MKIPVIVNSGVYRMPQKAEQVVNEKWICFNVSGHRTSTLYYPDGTLCSAGRSTDTTSLSLNYPGFRSVFEYGSNRENWVTMFKCDDLTYSTDDHTFYLNYNDVLLPVPRCIPVKQSEVDLIRNEFKTITEYFNSTIPRNQLAAGMMVCSLLLRFVQEPGHSDDVVEQFRKALDADTRWEHSLESICRSLGVGRDVMRRRFMERYKLAPGEYRVRKRLQRIQYLLSYTTLNMKEIAYEVGMKNQSHLSLFVQAQCGMTPSGLCRKYRNGK